MAKNSSTAKSLMKTSNSKASAKAVPRAVSKGKGLAKKATPTGKMGPTGKPGATGKPGGKAQAKSVSKRGSVTAVIKGSSKKSSVISTSKKPVTTKKGGAVAAKKGDTVSAKKNVATTAKKVAAKSQPASKKSSSKSVVVKRQVTSQTGKKLSPSKKPTEISFASKHVAARKLSGSRTVENSTTLKKAPLKKAAVSQDYSQFKAILLEKRRRLYGDVAMMSEEALGSEEATVDNHAPIHPAEVGSHSFEQEFTLGLLSRDGDKIRLVDLALEKMAEGSYGQCDECGCRIPKGRLEMLPESIYCVKCASKLEGSGF